METKNAPLAIGGAALAAFLLAPLGSRLATPPDSSPQPGAVAQQPAKPVDSASSLRSAGLMRDDSGPWYAICQEYATTQPDGTDVHIPPKPKELDTGTKPFQGDVEAIEIARDSQNKLTTKYSLKEHPARDIAGCLPANQKQRLLFMVVGVADPSASHLQMETDRAIEAVQHGASFMGYDFDRYWLPWADPSNMALPKLRRDAALQEEQPGILIFTKHGDNAFREDIHLFVFLYGESPTFGANRLQLENALHYIDVLSDSKRSQYPTYPIGYVGAYFSGSYPSISQILLSPRNKRVLPRIAMVNANSSDDRLISDFKSGMIERIRSYESLELRSKTVLDEAVGLAQRLGYRNYEVAILAEDESAYGSGIADPMQSGLDELQQSAQVEAKPQVAKMKFPRDLSALRNAADRQAGRPGVVDIGGIAVPTLGVPLTLHEGASNKQDSPTTYAPDQSAARIDRALQALVRRLRLQRIQFVILTSSNPLDSIYLLDYLHRAVPDVRLATVEADEFMLGRPKYVDFSGTITFSGLPILSDHKVVSVEKTAQADFPDGASEGVYLAVANLLNSDVTVVGDGKPPQDRKFGPKDSELEGIPNNCADASVVGRDGFYLLNDVDGEKQHYPCQGPTNVLVTRKTTGELRLPWAWVVTLFLVAGATSLHALVTLASRREIESLRILRTGAYTLCPDSPLRGIKEFFYFALNNQLLLIEFLVVTVTWGVRDVLHPGQKALFVLNLGLFFLMLAFSFITGRNLVTRHLRGERRERELRSGSGLMTLISSLIFVPWTAWMWMDLLRNGDTTSTWFTLDRAVALRSISLGDGISPLASITAILVAYALWALNNMRRLAFVETRRACVSLPQKDKSDLILRLRRLCRRISDALLISVGMSPLTMGLMVVTYGVAFCLFRVWFGLRGIDPEVYRHWSWPWHMNVDFLGFRTWMVVWGFTSLLVLVMFSAGRIWEAWLALRRLTQFLEQTPIRHAFDYVPKELSALQIWHIGGARKSFLLQSRTIDLINLLPPDTGGKPQRALTTVGAAHETFEFSGAAEGVRDGACADHDVAECRKLLNEIQELTEKWNVPSFQQVEKMNRLLNCRMHEALQCLTQDDRDDRTLWGLVQDSKTLQEQIKDDPAQSVPQIEELYVAYRFVAIFRYTLLQIRNMLWFLVYGYACLLVSIAVYPFQGRRSLGGLLSLVFLTLLVGVAALMFQMDRDSILRRLDHPVGAVGNFLSVASNLIMVGGIPLLAVLASQFPSVADFFFSWVRPLVGALH